jgi:hypothetical protein
MRAVPIKFVKQDAVMPKMAQQYIIRVIHPSPLFANWSAIAVSGE